MKQLNGVTGTAHITAHPYFRSLAEKQIEFYRAGLSHFNANAILLTQRRDNLRRRLMLKQLEDDLGENIDDFDDVFDEEEEDDGDIYS